MYNLFRLAVAIIPRLPRWSFPLLGTVLGTLAWLVAKSARKQAMTNMGYVLHGGAQVAPTRADRKRLRRTVRRMFQNNVRNYLEAFHLPSTRSKTIIESMQIDGIEHLEAALAKGKGVLLFSAHFGPFDFLSQWIAIKGYPVIIPVEHLQNQRMLDLMLNVRRSHGVQYIPLGGSAPMRKMLAALRSNQIVLLAADRVVQGEGVAIPFFGATAQLPGGPASLAQRTGAALVGAFGWRTYAKRGAPIQGEFVPLSLALPEAERASSDALLGGIVEKLEHFIEAHPDQWAAFAPIWPE